MLEHLRPWFIPAYIFGTALVLGWLLNRLLLGRLLALAKRSAWRFDDILFASLRGMCWLWIVLLGLRIAVTTAPIGMEVRELAHRGMQVLFVASLTLVLIRISTGSFATYIDRLPNHGSTIFRYLTNAMILVIGILVVLETQGVPIGPMLGALGVGGLAVALALQDTLANLFAGIHILMARQLRVGDSIRIESGQEGMVIDVGWRNTSIRTGNLNLVVIPNSKLAGSVIINRDLPSTTQNLPVTFRIAHDNDLERVEAALLDEAQRFTEEFTGCEPIAGLPAVRFNAFVDAGIDTSVTVRVKDIDAFNLGRHELNKRLHRRLRAEGIAIALPTRAIQVDGNAS